MTTLCPQMPAPQKGGASGVLLRVLAASLVAINLWASQDPDIAYSEKTVLILSADPAPSLKARVEVEQVYLSKRSTEHTIFTVSENHFARVQDLAGWVRGEKLSSGRLSHHFPQRRDIFLSSEKIHQLEFPKDLRPGEKVSFAYEQQFLEIAFTPMFQVPNEDTVRRFEITVEHPAAVRVDFDCWYPGAPLKPVISHPSPERTSILFENLPHQEPLEHFPYPSVQALVLPRFTRNGLPLNPVTPERFAGWYLKLLEAPSKPTATLPQSLAAALAKAGTSRQKVRVLFDFVKGNIRYAADEMAMNAIIPRNPEFVMKNGFGDCKDKAFLLSQLALQLGIKVDMALVFRNQSPEGVGLSVGSFDHVICHYGDAEGTLFMDPTHPDVEFGNLPMADVHRGALVLDPKEPRLVRIPHQRRASSLQLEITGSLDQPKKAEARVTLRNEFLAMAQRARRELRELDLENKLSNHINQQLFKISLDHFTFERETQDGMEFKALANLDDFLVKSPTRIYLPQIPFKTHDAGLMKRRDDPHPIDVEIRPWIQLQIDIDGAGLQTKPERVLLGDPALETFEASSRVTTKGTSFNYETRPSEDFFQGEAKSAYLEFFEKYLLQRRRMFAITGSQP